MVYRIIPKLSVYVPAFWCSFLNALKCFRCDFHTTGIQSGRKFLIRLILIKYMPIFIKERFLTTIHPKYYIFLGTSGKIQFKKDHPNHHNHHHEPQDDGRCPPSRGMFLITIYHLGMFLIIT